MKKINYLLLGAAGLILASCSQEAEIKNEVQPDGNVQLTINLPSDLKTRAYSDGFAATRLCIAVYDQDNNNALVLEDLDTYAFTTSLTTNVGLNLANGKTYNIALFALSQQAYTEKVYDFNPAGQVMKVDYDKMTNAGLSADAYDCFYKVENLTIGTAAASPIQLNITLTRPVAQINWGTSDLDETAVVDPYYFGQNAQYLMSSLNANVYDTLNLLTGEVMGVPANVQFPEFNIPTGLTFPVNGYEYIAIQYVLAPQATPFTTEFNLDVNNSGNTSAALIENKLVVANAPVQANYRTNIYGALLTDNVELTVTKDPNWFTPDKDVPAN